MVGRSTSKNKKTLQVKIGGKVFSTAGSWSYKKSTAKEKADSHRKSHPDHLVRIVTKDWANSPKIYAVYWRRK